MTIGDSVNWEWIIECAKKSGKDIILVTRDTDFGVHTKDESFLNDWLQFEFKSRVSRKRKIILTTKLTLAFKSIHLPVTKEMEEEENKILEKEAENIQIVPESTSLIWAELAKIFEEMYEAKSKDPKGDDKK